MGRSPGRAGTGPASFVVCKFIFIYPDPTQSARSALWPALGQLLSTQTPCQPTWGSHRRRTFPAPQAAGGGGPSHRQTGCPVPSQPTSRCFLSKVGAAHASPPPPQQKTTPPSSSKALTQQYPALWYSHSTRSACSQPHTKQNSIKATRRGRKGGSPTACGKPDLSLMLN